MGAIMRQSKSIFWILMGVLVFAGVAAGTMANIKYSIKKIDGTWYVVNEMNRPTPIQAKGNDIVEWTADGSNMSFQFPKESDKIFIHEDGTAVPSGYVINIEDGKKLKLKVKSDAPKGSYEYAVYVTADGTFAEGSSPPILVIY